MDSSRESRRREQRSLKRPLEVRRERRFHSLSDLMFESVRRLTFCNWTLTFIDPDQLARSGFFSLEREDHVQCVFCQGLVGFWDPDDLPEEEHRRHFPSCRLVSGMTTGNIPINHPENETGNAFRLLQDYHYFRVSSTRPVGKKRQSDSSQLDPGRMSFTQFNTETARRPTFNNWSKSEDVTPDALVKAGFFYTGLADWVQCYHCGGGLFAWRKGDDPSTDHARYYPWCPFIRNINQTPAEGAPAEEGASDNMPPPPIVRPIHLSKEEEELLLSLPLAKRLIQMGLEVKSVTGALKNKIERTGRFCNEVTEALELVFDYDERKLCSPTVLSRLSVQSEGAVTQASLPPVVQPPVEEPSAKREAKVEELRNRKQQLEQEVVELQKSVEEEQQRLMCRICKSRSVQVMIQPCSHLHFCETCARPLDRCPTCNGPVRGTLRPIMG